MTGEVDREGLFWPEVRDEQWVTRRLVTGRLPLRHSRFRPKSGKVHTTFLRGYDQVPSRSLPLIEHKNQTNFWGAISGVPLTIKRYPSDAWLCPGNMKGNPKAGINDAALIRLNAASSSGLSQLGSEKKSRNIEVVSKKLCRRHGVLIIIDNQRHIHFVQGSVRSV